MYPVLFFSIKHQITPIVQPTENYQKTDVQTDKMRTNVFFHKEKMGDTTQQGNLFPRNVIPRNFFTRNFISKELFSKECRFQGKLFSRNLISKEFFLQGIPFQGVFQNTLFHILVTFLHGSLQYEMPYISGSQTFLTRGTKNY